MTHDGEERPLGCNCTGPWDCTCDDMMNAYNGCDTPELIRTLFKKPFSYDCDGQCIMDADNKHVVDIRGWGYIQYLDNPEQRQDALGQFVAKLLNENYFPK